MAFVRTLPTALSRRFRGAERAIIWTQSVAVEVVVAGRFVLRLRGLAGLDAVDLAPLLLPRCRSLHTFGMRTPIDVVWLESGSDGEGSVRAIAGSVRPRRSARAPRGSARGRTAALELPAGDAEALGLQPGTHFHLGA